MDGYEKDKNTLMKAKQNYYDPIKKKHQLLE